MSARASAPCRAFATAVVAAALLATAASAARAETRRIAVLVGSNVGDAEHAPLRYAEQDAARLAAVLGELGGLAPVDVILLRGPTPAAVRAALDEAAKRVASWHAENRGQTVLLFYYSGHSDGQVLELGGQALPFSEVRKRLASTGADVRLVIVDSCRSGALLALKGGRLGQAFDIRLADDLASTGEAFIASSAADESALESSEIGASFFSHHFISGLRGAADLSGDGLVTLAEAYQYAFARTLRATSETTIGPQHAAYDYHLAGRGDLVLTELLRPSAVLDLPSEFDRLLLVAPVRLEVVAELGPRSAHRIAVGAGAYQLRAWRGRQAFVGNVKVDQGQELKVAAADLRPTVGEPVARKGDGGAPVVIAAAPSPREPPERGPWAVTAAAGLADGVADGASLGVVRAGVERSFGARRLAALLTAGTGRAPGMRENRFGAELLPSLWTGRGPARAGIGLGVGAGVALEHTDAGQVHWSGLAWASPTALLEVRLARALALGIGGELPITVLRRDGALAVAMLPAAWVGLSQSF
jgi:hypothetical protein